MGFFPRDLMPLTTKLNSPTPKSGAGPARVDKDQYNTHDQELLAIQTVLGTQSSNSVQGTPQQEIGASGPFKDGLLGLVGKMIDQLNCFAMDGVAVSSGYVSKCGQIVFPEDIKATYLTNTPSTSDATILAGDTSGFPASGIITIINDVHQAIVDTNTGTWSRTSDSPTLVEWIKYSSKTSTSFNGCTRGFLGTTKGPHAGGIELATDPVTDSLKNVKDIEIMWESMANVVTRRYRGWSNRQDFTMPILNLKGSYESISDSIRLLASSFRVSTSYDATQVASFIDVANSVGILGTRASGTYYLKSADPTHASAGTLTADEALAFTAACSSAQLIADGPTADDFDFPPNAVPIFQGKMGLTISPSLIGEGYPILGTQVFLDALGRIMVFGNDDRNFEVGQYATAGYSIFHVPSPRLSAERNS